jgi:hypothetical protein
MAIHARPRMWAVDDYKYTVLCVESYVCFDLYFVLRTSKWEMKALRLSDVLASAIHRVLLELTESQLEWPVLHLSSVGLNDHCLL